VYAALRTDRACFSFVVQGFIATPSMVRAGSSYSDAVNMPTIEKIEPGLDGAPPVWVDVAVRSA
jgi:hypothetical protein